ncbi:mas-related G-protein coupled receptor member D-like [Antechinus flavipes]|uniref:mas-related G-protein coupled receptor member D-like n=1 Tax=Antechinus flavipes TaxID=38775 RepID=UPI0022364F12|nr:mas-related G-protein coupled receptor member D-like [Antechinus flavipes]
MTTSPTPEHVEHVYDKAAVRCNRSVLGSELMQIPSLLIAPLGLMGNGVVLWLLGFRIRRTPFSVYILNLAGADALFLCCSLLDSIENFVRYFHDLFKHEIMLNLNYLFYTTGMSLLAAISTERCLSVLFPIWYRCHRPKHTSASVCAVLWALVGSLWVNGLVTCSHISWHVLCRFNILEGVCFILLTCVLCVSSLTLLLRVQCSSQSRQPPRLYLLVLLTVLVFLLCGLPWGIEDLICYHLKGRLLPHWLFQLLACVNSSMNPLIYFFLGSQSFKRKREPLRVILQRVLGDEQELGGGTSDMPHTSIQEMTL